MKTFLLLSAGQGILLSLGLISSVVLKKWSNLFLGLITLIISLEILNTWGIQVNYHNQDHRFPFWIFSSYLTLPAAIYLFGKLNTRQQFRIKSWHILLFIPAIVEILVEFYTNYSNQYLGTAYRPIHNTFWFWFTEILPLIAMMVVLFLFGLDIYRLGSQSRKLFPLSQSWQLIKISTLYGLFLLITALWFLESVVHLPLFLITLFILCTFIFSLGYISFFKPDFFNVPKYLTKASNPKYDAVYNDESEAKRIHETFLQSKMYAQPRLTLKEAADKLNLPSRYLSTLINKYYGLDFRAYVNTLRVEEVIRKVEVGDDKQKTLLGIAMESGFNSKSAFNKAFKDIKGKSPSHFFATKAKKGS